jgi:endonuclease YncB( thermonuclease family)
VILRSIALLCIVVTLAASDVKRVIDGDTWDLHPFTIYGPVQLDVQPMAVLHNQRVRPLAIDTPERGQPLFAIATDSTRSWLSRGAHKMEACSRDFNGRLLAWITRGIDSLHVFLGNAGLSK